MCLCVPTAKVFTIYMHILRDLMCVFDPPIRGCRLTIVFPYVLLHTFPQTLRKHAYSNILKILPAKNETFQIKNSNIFSYF